MTHHEPDAHQAPAEVSPHLPPPNSFERQIPRTRYIFILPIIAAYIAAVVLMVFGFIETFSTIFEVLAHSDGHALETLRLHIVEAVDVFLLATILYVIAGGFYQLTVNPQRPVAPWLKVDSVHDLEVMLVGVVITLLGVTGLAFVMSWDGQSDLLPVGAAIALLIAALAFFLGRSSH